MKSLYDSALSGISKLMDSKIDSYTESKEIAIESLEAEKQAAEDAYQSQIDAIDDMIDRKKETIDSIRDEIDAMKEAREERKREIDLQKAQYDLERMKNQRTILQYSENKGLHYVTDTSGIRDAKEKVDDAKFEIEVAAKEKEIKLLEDEIDLLEKQKNALEDAQEASNKYYDNLIKQQEKYWDSMIKSMEQQKSKWEELAEIEEIAQAYSAVEQVFGDLGYTVQDILNGNEQAFEDFKSKYINILNDMNSNTSFAEGLSYATGVAKENLGSFLDKTKETADGISDLSAKSSELTTVAKGMDGLASSATTASEGTSAIAENMGELNTDTEGLSENLDSISDSLSEFPEADNISNLAEAFQKMGEAVKDMADALGTGGDEASGLVGALKSLSDLSLSFGEMDDKGKGTGILAQFQKLKDAVDNVTNAITGGGTSASENGDASNSSSPSMSTDAGNQTGGGLTGAINSIQSTTETALSGGSGGSTDKGETEETAAEGTGGAIGQFDLLKEAVDNVTKTIGSEKKADEDTLIGALRAQYDVALEKLPETKSLFEELLVSIMACVTALGSMVSMMGSMSEIGGFSVTGIPTHAKGTVGNAFAKGTGHYKGLPKDEKNALRSEYGQPELTVYPDGTTELTTSPVMSDLPKGTVIFNEEQTKKIMNNKSHGKIIKSYASGVVEYSDGTFIKPDGSVVPPLQEGSRTYDMLQKFSAYMNSIDNNVEKLSANIMHEQSKQMHDAINQINNSNVVNNNRPSVSIGDIHVTCPGVTSQEVAKQVGVELNNMFNGLHLEAMQQSMMR